MSGREMGHPSIGDRVRVIGGAWVSHVGCMATVIGVRGEIVELCVDGKPGTLTTAYTHVTRYVDDEPAEEVRRG